MHLLYVVGFVSLFLVAPFGQAKIRKRTCIFNKLNEYCVASEQSAGADEAVPDSKPDTPQFLTKHYQAKKQKLPLWLDPNSPLIQPIFYVPDAPEMWTMPSLIDDADADTQQLQTMPPLIDTDAPQLPTVPSWIDPDTDFLDKKQKKKLFIKTDPPQLQTTPSLIDTDPPQLQTTPSLIDHSPNLLDMMPSFFLPKEIKFQSKKKKLPWHKNPPKPPKPRTTPDYFVWI